MIDRTRRSLNTAAAVLGFALLAGACTPAPARMLLLPTPTPLPAATEPATVEAFPTRPPFPPGELVDYTAQAGDTLPALAVHFNTTEAAIRAANPAIPQDATTMPPGMPMKIPIYYLPYWGNPYQILPDSLFINGPAQVGFNTSAFVEQHPGWLKTYSEYAGDATRSGAQIVDYVATNFSISPRLLLALLEHQTGALSWSLPPASDYPLGYSDYAHKGLYLQLVWAANTLNNGYYGWRTGSLSEFERLDGRIERPDPWQNAGSVALQFYFSRLLNNQAYDLAIGEEGFAQTYAGLFGSPWESPEPHIPASLQQPAFSLPFEAGRTWNYTGGPHTGWGKGEPYAGIDFAPTGVSECSSTSEWAVAMAAGVVARVDKGIVVLDLDGDGDERTGWTIFYLHLADFDRAPPGALLQPGDRVGHPSCEGGESTGTHVHIARRYNGEWIPADGPLGFNLDGWLARNGNEPYEGTLTRAGQTVVASSKSESGSQIQADPGE